MMIDHRTMVHAGTLCQRYRRTKQTPNAADPAKPFTITTRAYRLEIVEDGLKICGYDKTSLKTFLTYSQIVSWRDLESPVGKMAIENRFEAIDAAVDKQIQDSANVADPPARTRQIFPPARPAGTP